MPARCRRRFSVSCAFFAARASSSVGAAAAAAASRSRFFCLRSALAACAAPASPSAGASPPAPPRAARCCSRLACSAGNRAREGWCVQHGKGKTNGAGTRCACGRRETHLCSASAPQVLAGHALRLLGLFGAALCAWRSSARAPCSAVCAALAAVATALAVRRAPRRARRVATPVGLHLQLLRRLALAAVTRTGGCCCCLELRRALLALALAVRGGFLCDAWRESWQSQPQARRVGSDAPESARARPKRRLWRVQTRLARQRPARPGSPPSRQRRTQPWSASLWAAPAQRRAVLVLASACQGRDTSFSSALPSPFTLNTAAMPSGLKGALLGFGNPLLDISAGARRCARRCVQLPLRGRAPCAARNVVSGARTARSSVAPCGFAHVARSPLTRLRTLRRCACSGAEVHAGQV